MARYSRYAPMPYQSTYVGNYEAEYAKMYEALQHKQDQAEGALAAKWDSVLNTKVVNTEDRDRAIKEMKQYTDSLMENTKGNYATNMGKVLSTINEISAHPFHNLNAKQLEEIKKRDEARMRFPNIIETGDPSKTPLFQNGKWVTPDQISYDYVDKDAVSKEFLTQNKAFAELSRPGTKFKPVPGAPGYIGTMDTEGLTPEEIISGNKDYNVPSFSASNEESTKTFLQQNSRYAEILSKKYNGDISKILAEAGQTKEELAKANLVRGSKPRVLQDQSLDIQLKRAQLASLTQVQPIDALDAAPGDVTQNNIDIIADRAKKLNKDSTLDKNKMEFDAKGKLISNVSKAALSSDDIPWALSPTRVPLKPSSRNSFDNNPKKDINYEVAQKVIKDMKQELFGLGIASHKMTDKQVYDYYNKAVENTYNTFGTDLRVRTGYKIESAHPFLDNTGNLKPYDNDNLQKFDPEKNKWIPVPQAEMKKLLKENGVDLETIEGRRVAKTMVESTGADQFSTVGDMFNYSIIGETRLRSAAPMRLKQAFERTSKIKEIATIPGKHQIPVNGGNITIETRMIPDATGNGRQSFIPIVTSVPEKYDELFRKSVLKNYGEEQAPQIFSDPILQSKVFIDFIQEQDVVTAIKNGAIIPTETSKIKNMSKSSSYESTTVTN